MGSVIRALRAGAVSLLFHACAPAVTSPAPETSSPTTDSPRESEGRVTPFERGLAAARERRDRVIAKPAPTYAGDGDKASALAFIRTEVASWVKVQKPAVDDALATYERALPLAISDLERGTVIVGLPGPDGKPVPFYALATDVAASTESVAKR